MDGQFVQQIKSNALNMTGSQIPEEPMYLLLNTAMSSTWGFNCVGQTDDCACDCFDCNDPKCACAVPKGLCGMLPVSFEIDWVRVYQSPNNPNQTIGCSPPNYPTKVFIEGHISDYMDEGDFQPLMAVPTGSISAPALSPPYTLHPSSPFVTALLSPYILYPSSVLTLY